MRLHIALTSALALAFVSANAPAQTTETPEQRLDRVERRLGELESRHQEELKARDAEIERLKAALADRAASSATAPAAGAGAAADDIEKTQEDILRDIRENRSGAAGLRTPASFNPDLAVITDFRGSISSNNDNPARNRFDVGSVELSLRAAVDPRADAVVILPVVREIEDPLFPDPDDLTGDIETAIELEEAYLFLHDFGVPNLTAKLGRFHLRFGRQNMLHAHDWPTVDNNFVNQSFLGAEALSDSGLSLSYVIPPAWVGKQYVEAIVEIITGEGSEGAPVLNNNALIDGPALNVHLLWNRDIARDWNLEVGGSWLTASRNNDNQQDVNLVGLDLTLIHTDPSGGFNNQLFQAELIYGDVDVSRDETSHAFGAYVLAQQQLHRDWFVGCRLDWTQNALDDNQEVWGVSPYVSWYWSEFLRFRLEYQHKSGDVPEENTLFMQATWVFGAHPPHPYWVMR